MTMIASVVQLMKRRNEQRLALVREESERELDRLMEAVTARDARALDDLGRELGANAALIERLQTWQEMSERHHAVEYHALAVDIEPFLLQLNPRITGQRVIQTWFETARGNQVRVTYKRHRPIDSRIAIQVNSGVESYFGPTDQLSIEALLRPL